jgi:hypothetical protein
MGENKLFEETQDKLSEEFDNIDHIYFFKKFQGSKFYPYLISLLKKEIESTDYTKDDLFNALNLIRNYLNYIIGSHKNFIDNNKTIYKDPSVKVVTDSKKIQKIQEYGKKYRKYYNDTKNTQNIDKMIKLLKHLSNNIIVKRMNEIFLKKEEEKKEKEVEVEEEGEVEEEEVEEVEEEENVRPRSVSNKSLSMKSVVIKNKSPDYFEPDTNSSSSDYMTILPLSKVNSGGKRRTHKRKRSIKRKRSNTKRSNTKRSNTKRSNRKTKRRIKRSNTKT